MAIPDHEKLPVKDAKGRKPGNMVLARMVQMSYLMDVQGMSISEIYEWQQRPKLSKEELEETGEAQGGGWYLSAREINHLAKKARAHGANLLFDDQRKNTIGVLRQYYDLKRKSLAGGDFRVAFLCVREIAKIRNVNPGLHKHGRRLADDYGHPIKWREIISAQPMPNTDPPVSSEEAELIGMGYGA